MKMDAGLAELGDFNKRTFARTVSRRAGSAPVHPMHFGKNVPDFSIAVGQV